jgi:shikimate 5-dehydrogenase
MWMDALGVEDACLVGLDFSLNDDPARYRAAVEHIKYDPFSLGALVTSHKLNVMRAAKDLFDSTDEFAGVLSEVSCIYKRDGQLIAAAKDAITSGLTLDQFVPENHWTNTGADVLLLGAGGASAACSWHMLHPDRGVHRPARMIITDINKQRLDHLKSIHAQLNSAIPIDYHVAANGDALLSTLKPGSLIINATGLGKDRPGSPLSNDAIWPTGALAWEFNYRGELSFLKQAKRHAAVVEDGWRYFIYGWTRVIAEVLQLDIPTEGPEFNMLCTLGAAGR